MAGRLEAELRDTRVELARMEERVRELGRAAERLKDGDTAFENIRLRLDRIERAMKMRAAIEKVIGTAVLTLLAKVFFGVAA